MGNNKSIQDGLAESKTKKITANSTYEEVMEENSRIYKNHNKKDWTTAQIKYPIFIGSDLVLSPGITRHVYKLARVKVGKEYSNTVSVLLTLLINSQKTKISFSHEHNEQKIDTLVPKQKYCVQSASVVAAQLVGDYENVNFVMSMMNNAEVKFVSNFITTNKDFEYELGTEIIEQNAFQEGTGCLQGIHVFADEKSAIDYVNTGFTNALRSPVISSKVYMRDVIKNKLDYFESMYDRIGNDTMFLSEEPRHLRKEKLQGIKDRWIYFYDNSIDHSSDKVIYPNVRIPFDMVDGAYDVEMDKKEDDIIIKLKKIVNDS
jgi:hypothetical protein